MEVNMKDAINPSHYKNEGQPECIELIHKIVKNCGDPFLGFCLGQIKYLYRFGKKDHENGVEDVKKFLWYMNHYLENLTEDIILENPRMTLDEAREIAHYFACDKGNYATPVYQIVIEVCMLDTRERLEYIIYLLKELVQMMETNC